MGRSIVVFLATLVLVAIAAATSPRTTTATAPFPPLDACLGSGVFQLQDLICSAVRPTRGDDFGPITSVQQATLEPGGAIQLTFPADVDFDTPTGPCGDLGCPHASILWRAQGSGAGVAFVDGCGGRDRTCTVRLDPSVGDAGESVVAVFAQQYAGIRPVDGVAYALYAPPQLYPVRVNPIDSRGRAVPIEPGDQAFAVRDGSNALQADCVAPDWWIAASRQAKVVAPDCITLPADGSGTAGAFAGILPNGDRWTVTALPAGDQLQPLSARPTAYKRIGIAIADGDIWTTIVRQERPVLEVSLVPETTTMDLGATQLVALRLRAVGGDAGSLSSITFNVPELLEAVSSPDAALTIGPPSSPPATPLTLGIGATQTIEVPVTATGTGTTILRVTGTAIDDIGSISVDGVSLSITATAGAGVPGDGPGPVITRAHDVAASPNDAIEGTISGTSGDRVTVSLAASPRTAEGTCAGTMDGDGVEPLGSVAVEIGPDGSGTFNMTRTLGPGRGVYGIAVVGGTISAVGACTPVTVDAPEVSVADAELDEQAPGTKAGGSTEVTISLSDPAEAPVTVSVHTVDGTATAPADYVALAPTIVTIPAGALSTTVALQAVPDRADEPDETFSVQLSEVTGGVLGRDSSTATIFLVDQAAPAAAFTMRGSWHLAHRLGGRWVEQQNPMTIKRFDPGTGRFTGTEQGGNGEVVDITGQIKGSRLTATLRFRTTKTIPGTYTCTLDRSADPVTAACDYRSGSYRTKARWTQVSSSAP